MKCQKAKELFSELHEQTLSGGLKQTVERHLFECPVCQEDYRAFKVVYDQIGSLPSVQEPEDLHERIMRRVDRAAWDRKQAAPAGFLWLRSLAFAGVAAAVVGVAYVGYKQLADGTTQAVPVPVPAPVTQAELPVVARANGWVTLQFTARESTEILLREGGSDYSALPPEDALQLQKRTLEPPKRLTIPHKNEGPRATVVWAVVEGVPKVTAVFLPGAADIGFEPWEGEVGLIEGLLRICDEHSVIIDAQLAGAVPVSRMDSAGASLQDALDRLLDGTGYTWEESGGVIRIR
ncbi:MAG: secretin and TonB N-terminal domain-containing protein [Armatimonadetes bacterium]|nr:secretin and TonB N-terminal domain-containing protein [Armatimonadota bacterium]